MSVDTETEKRLGREGLFTAAVLSLAVCIVATTSFDDFYLGASLGAAVALVPASILAMKPSARPFGSGMLVGAVLAFAVEIVLVFAYFSSL